MLRQFLAPFTKERPCAINRALLEDGRHALEAADLLIGFQIESLNDLTCGLPSPTIIVDDSKAFLPNKLNLVGDALKLVPEILPLPRSLGVQPLDQPPLAGLGEVGELRGSSKMPS